MISLLTGEFEPMLSGKIASEKDYNRFFPKPTASKPNRQIAYLASPKLDGIRVCLHPQVGACTRTIKPIRNSKLLKALRTLCNEIPELQGLDGEITAGPPELVTSPTIFNDTTSAVMSGTGHPTIEGHTFWVFDKFYSHNCDNFHALPFTARYANIIAVLKKLSNTDNIWFQLLEQVPITSRDELDAQESKYVEAGYEGLMLRNPNSPYKFGRSTITEGQQHLTKLKRFEDAEGKITQFHELQHNENEAEEDNFGRTERSSSKANLRPGNTLGKVTLEVLTGDYKGVSVRCGSGFNQAQRQEIWNNQDKYLGRVVNFKYQAVGSIDKPRIPIFKGFRED